MRFTPAPATRYSRAGRIYSPAVLSPMLRGPLSQRPRTVAETGVGSKTDHNGVCNHTAPGGIGVEGEALKEEF